MLSFFWLRPEKRLVGEGGSVATAANIAAVSLGCDLSVIWYEKNKYLLKQGLNLGPERPDRL